MNDAGNVSSATGAKGVSIVIPTCRDSRFTVRCLESVCLSLDSWQGPKELVLAVDRELRINDPLFELARRYLFVRLIRNEGLSGGPRTRNLALRTAVHPILVFTDDDCVVPRDWVARMVQGALEFGIFTGGVAAADPVSVFSGVKVGTASRRFRALWRMEEIIDTYRLSAIDSAGRSKYVSFPNLAILRELLPPVPFDSIFAESADDMDLGYRLRINGSAIRADLDGSPVRTGYPVNLRKALRRKLRHARGIAYVHRRMGEARMTPLEPGSWLRILFRWIRISLAAQLPWRDRFVFLLINLTYCLGLGWYLWRLRGIREFQDHEILRGLEDRSAGLTRSAGTQAAACIDA